MDVCLLDSLLPCGMDLSERTSRNRDPHRGFSHRGFCLSAQFLRHFTSPWIDCWRSIEFSMACEEHREFVCLALLLFSSFSPFQIPYRIGHEFSYVTPDPRGIVISAITMHVLYCPRFCA